LEIAKLGSSGTITNLLRLKDTTAGGAAGTGASIGFQVVGNTVDTGAISSFYDGTNYPMTFMSYNSASLQEVMRIVNGNVGIGTTSPSALLSVGSTSQFQVNSSGVMSAAYGSTAANSGGTQEAICLADGTGGCVTLGGALSNSNFTTGAGGGGSSIPSFSVTGNDASFEVGITTGTTPSASTEIFSIAYTAPRASSYCSVTPANANASAAQVWFVSIDQHSLHLASGLVPLTAATSYVWSFVCP
jgi:hypothetical protein